MLDNEETVAQKLGYKYFDSDLMFVDFIKFTSELGSWECKNFSLSSTSGNVLDIDTKQFGSSHYTQFLNLQQYIDIFMNNIGKEQYRMNIKLICPDGIKIKIDADNIGYNFYLLLSIYNDNIYFKCISEKTNGEIINFNLFEMYMEDLYQQWKQFHLLQNQIKKDD